MAVTENAVSDRVNINLNNGADEDGNVKTVALNLGSLDGDNWDATKVMNIVDALEACLSKVVYSVSHVKTTTMVQD